jgi:hypothetical protein
LLGLFCGVVSEVSESINFNAVGLRAMVDQSCVEDLSNLLPGVLS